MRVNILIRKLEEKDLTKYDIKYIILIKFKSIKKYFNKLIINNI